MQWVISRYPILQTAVIRLSEQKAEQLQMSLEMEQKAKVVQSQLNLLFFLAFWLMLSNLRVKR